MLDTLPETSNTDVEFTPNPYKVAEKPGLHEWLAGANKVAVIEDPQVLPPQPEDRSHFGWGRVDQMLVEGADRFTRPNTSPNFPEVVSKLVRTADPDIGYTEFLGGPLDLRQRGQVEKAWLQPIQIEDPGSPDIFTDFHIIYSGLYPWEFAAMSPEDQAKIAVIFSPANESDLKLDNTNDPHVKKLRETISGQEKKPKIVVLLSTVGSIFYPRISTPSDFPKEDVFFRHMNQLQQGLGLSIPITETDYNVMALQASFVAERQAGDFGIGQPKKIENSQGTFYVYGVHNPEDPWQYYEIYTPEPLNQIDVAAEAKLRIDSGCDIGQCYGDEGCDCHAQLLKALGEIKKDGGLIIHAPTQDGRGYGMGTKMETEGGKRGFPGAFNIQDGQVMPSVGTITAAELVFGEGENFDLRTFDGMAELLISLGFSKIGVYTDNARKKQALEKAGLEVRRIKTDTMNDPNVPEEARMHIQEKHNSPLYLQGD